MYSFTRVLREVNADGTTTLLLSWLTDVFHALCPVYGGQHSPMEPRGFKRCHSELARPMDLE